MKRDMQQTLLKTFTIYSFAKLYMRVCVCIYIYGFFLQKWHNEVSETLAKVHRV